MKPLLAGLFLVVPIVLIAAAPQATIVDSGSTNIPGLRVTVDRACDAMIEPRGGETHRLKLHQPLCERLMHDLDAAGPLPMLEARHCMKSVSFGSRLTIEFNGQQSPDLSCPSPVNPHVAALQEDARALLDAAREAADIHPRRVFMVPAPQPPKS